MRVNGLKLTLLISLFLVIGIYLVMGLTGLGVQTPSNHTIINGTTFFNVSAGDYNATVFNASFYLYNASAVVFLGRTNNGTWTRDFNLTVDLNATNLSLAETILVNNVYNITVNFTNATGISSFFNATGVNLSIDNYRPDIYNVNVTDGSTTLGQTQLNGTKYLKNVTLTVMAEIIDTSGTASLIYNYSNNAVRVPGRLERNYFVHLLNGTVNITNITTTFGEGTNLVNYLQVVSVTSRGVLNSTLPARPHGTNFSFAIAANDSMAVFPAPGTPGSPHLSGVYNSRVANNTVGFNFTVDGIRPVAQITLTEGGTALDDGDTVTRGATVVITCRESSGDTLPAHSLNITVDRPGGDGDSTQTNAIVGRRGDGASITLNFDTAGSGESNGEFTAKCQASDVGSTSETTRRFTVAASGGTTGTTGGGGGGAGGSGTPQTTTKTIEYASIVAGKLKVIQNIGGGLKSISFKLKSSVTAATMEVATSATKPSTVPSAPNSKVARFFEIKTTSIKNENIDEATITFEVDKAWMDSNNIKDNEIALYRYDNNKWEKFLATKAPVQSATNKVTYRSNVPGFSVWAIAFAEAAPTPGAGEEEDGTGETGEAGEEEPTPEVSKPSKAGTIVLWVVIIIIVVGAIAYYLMKKKKPVKKAS